MNEQSNSFPQHNVDNVDKDEGKTEQNPLKIPNNDLNTYNFEQSYQHRNVDKVDNSVNNQHFVDNHTKYGSPRLSTKAKVMIIISTVMFCCFLVGYGIYFYQNFDRSYLSSLLSYGENFEYGEEIYPSYSPQDETQGETAKQEVLPNEPEECKFTDSDFKLELKENNVEVNEQSNVRMAFDKLSVSTVAIAGDETDSENLEDYSDQGSGIILSENGYILTNYHVISSEKNMYYTVVLSDSTRVRADLVGYDSRTDIAVLKIRNAEDFDLVPAEFANSDQISIGETVIAVGNPGGIEFQNSLSDGIVSALNRSFNSDKMVKYIQTNAAINPGGSGGPLANLSGQVIGINTLKISGTSFEGMCFAIPSKQAQKIVNDIVNFGYVKDRVRLGISGMAVLNTEYANYDISNGIVIGDIADNGPLANTEIMVGDIITELDGQKVTSFADVYNILEGHRAGDKVRILVERYDDRSYKHLESIDVEIELQTDYGSATKK